MGTGGAHEAPMADATFSRFAALLVGGGVAVFLVGLWFVVPLLRRR